MALIKCEECGHLISTKAISCPNCGCPVERETKTEDFIEITKSSPKKDLSSNKKKPPRKRWIKYLAWCTIVLILLVGGCLLYLYLTDESVYEMELRRANAGHPYDQWIIGMYYYDGNGVERDYATAVSWWLKAAEQDYFAAQEELGKCYEEGKGVQQDMNEAIRWYTKAAEHGAQGAINRLNELNVDWEKLANNRDTSIPNEKSDNASLSDKKSNSVTNSKTNKKRKSPPSDPDVLWSQRNTKAPKDAAEWGANVFDSFYFVGAGEECLVSGDYDSAIEWFVKACKIGVADGYYYIGLCFELGWGSCEVNTDAARKYYVFASQHGSLNAQADFKRITSHGFIKPTDQNCAAVRNNIKYKMEMQAAIANANMGVNDFDANSVSISSSSSNFQTEYSRWEQRAASCYQSLTSTGISVTNINTGQKSGSTLQGWNTSNYTQLKRTFREAQNKMIEIRQKAAQSGVTITPSVYETATVSY